MMTTQPSDWAIARAFRQTVEAFPNASGWIADTVINTARELDASRGVIPMDRGPWRAGDDGKDVFSEDFAADVALRISGDFIDDHHRKDYAAWLARTLNGASPRAAEAGDDTWELADLHDSLRAVYEQVPTLPITAETMDAATDALHNFCLMVGIHEVDVDSPIDDAARSGGGS
jgi:hypothetical protein